MNRQKLIEIFKRLKAQNPAPTTELRYANHFQLLVAVMLSAQATDVSVNKATRDLFKQVKTPHEMLNLTLAQVKQHIKSIGLYNTKAVNVLKTSKILVDQHQGRVPRTRVALEALPGVGRKTANVILNTAFGEPTIAVDTHIFRVANRIGLAKGKTPLQVEQKLVKSIPAEFLQDAHHWLILHGRYTCIARRPKCSQCVIYDLCEFSQKATYCDSEDDT